MKAITYRLITLLAFLVLPFSGISQAYVKQDNACVPIDAPHPTKRIFFEKPMQLNEYVSPWFQAVTCSDVEKEGILEVDYVKVFQLDDNGNATRIQTINYNDSKPLTENEGRLYKRAWNDKNLFFYENATKQMSNSIKVDSSLKIDVGSFPNDISHWWCKRFLGSTHYRYFTVVKFKIKGEIAFQMGCDYYQNPDNLLNCKEAWVSEWYGDTNGAFVIDTFPKYSNSSFDCMDYGFTSEGVFYFSERFIDYAAADSVYLGGSFNGWSSKVKLSLRNGYYQHNTNKQLDTPQIYYIAAYYDNKVAYIPHLLIDKIANPNDVKSNGNNGYNFETSPNDSIGCIELYLPQKAGKPTGENNLCIPASNTEYNTTGAKNANTYHWKIHPTEAGTTNSITNYATVEWNNTFTGMARISVAGENEYGQGRFSEELTIQVNSETIPGIIESDSIICINKKTNSLILKNYSGQILRWQKKYENEDWNNIESKTSQLSEMPDKTGWWQYRVEVKNGNCKARFSEPCSVYFKALPNNPDVISGQTSLCPQMKNTTYTINKIPYAEHYQWTLPDGFIGESNSNSITIDLNNKAISGNIFVKGLNNCGESEASSILVEVQNNPSPAGNISGSDTVCQNEKKALYTIDKIPNAVTYQWYLPDGYIGDSDSNSITVDFYKEAISGDISVQGVNRCGVGKASTFKVVVNETPDTPEIKLAGNKLSSNTASGNQWYNQDGIIDGANEQYLTAEYNGIYFAIVTLSGCSSEASDSINVSITSAETLSTSKKIKIYPNPVLDKLVLISEEKNDLINFQIFNAAGKIIQIGSFTNYLEISTSSFSSGIYSIKFERSNLKEQIKFLKIQ